MGFEARENGGAVDSARNGSSARCTVPTYSHTCPECQGAGETSTEVYCPCCAGSGEVSENGPHTRAQILRTLEIRAQERGA
jgi:DnaJ-class molecular chaperone